MKFILFTVCTFALSAFATPNCHYSIPITVADKTFSNEECWELINWTPAQMNKICKPVQQEGSAPSKATLCTQASCKCKAGNSLVCKNATYKSPSASSLPPEYLAQMPKEVQAQIKANMDRAGSATRDLDGKKYNVYYYKSSFGTLEDQKQDCKNKGGTF